MRVSNFLSKLLKLSKSSRIICSSFIFVLFAGFVNCDVPPSPVAIICAKQRDMRVQSIADNVKETEQGTVSDVKENTSKPYSIGKQRVFGPISDSGGRQIYIINGERYIFDGQCFDGPISD